MTAFKSSIVLIICSLISISVLGQNPKKEQEKIEHLLEMVKTSDVKFIRNNKEHSATEAFEHMKTKYNSAKISWFSPPEKDWTANLFIEKIASRSSITGKPYLIRLKDGKVLEASSWLKIHLKKIESTK